MALSRAFGLSRRQAYRYLELGRAGASAPLPVENSVTVTLKMPASLSHDAALRNTLTGSPEQATVDVTRLEDGPEKIDKPTVPHPSPHTLQKQPVMNSVEVARQITFDDPATLRATAILQLYLHGADGMMHASLRPKAIAACHWLSGYRSA